MMNYENSLDMGLFVYSFYVNDFYMRKKNSSLKHKKSDFFSQIESQASSLSEKIDVFRRFLCIKRNKLRKSTFWSVYSLKFSLCSC